MADKIEKKIEKMAGKIDKFGNDFSDFDKKTTKKLEDHDKKFDRVFNKLLEQDVRFDQLETKLEGRIEKSENRILAAIDSFMGKTQKVELEQYATGANMERMQDNIDKNSKDIIRIKKVVKMT